MRPLAVSMLTALPFTATAVPEPGRGRDGAAEFGDGGGAAIDSVGVASSCCSGNGSGGGADGERVGVDAICGRAGDGNASAYSADVNSGRRQQRRRCLSQDVAEMVPPRSVMVVVPELIA